MGVPLNLIDIQSGFLSATAFNQNNTLTEEALAKALNRTSNASDNAMEVDLDMGLNRIFNVSTDATNPTDLLTVEAADERYLNTDGDALNGNIDAAGFNITNLGIPTNPNDAARLADVGPDSSANLRTELSSSDSGKGSDLVAHTGTTDTVTHALDKRTIYVGSVAKLEALSSISSGQEAIVSGTPFKYDGTNWLPSSGFVTVEAFGAVGDGVTDDSASIQAAIDFQSQSGSKGGVVRFSNGDYHIEQPLAWKAGTTLSGQSVQRQTVKGSTISSDVSDLIVYDDTDVGGIVENLTLISRPGGGHIFNCPTAVSRCEHRNLALIQENDDKSILHAVTAVDIDRGYGYFGNWWHHFDAVYSTTNTVPAFNIQGWTINQVTFEAARVGRAAIVSGGDYAFYISSNATAAPGFDCSIKQITMQQPGGGGIFVGGQRSFLVEGVGVFDMTAGASAPTLHVASGAGGIPSSVEVSSSFFGENPSDSVRWDSASGHSMVITNCQITNFNNTGATALIAVSRLPSSYTGPILYYGPEGTKFIGEAGSGVEEFNFRYGVPGNFNGYVGIQRNGANVGGWDLSGNFMVGSSLTSPTIRLLLDGRATFGGAYIAQNGARWISDTGSPEGVFTAPVGSMYSRQDGGAGTSFYVKESGSGTTGWVAK